MPIDPVPVVGYAEYDAEARWALVKSLDPIREFTVTGQISPGQSSTPRARRVPDVLSPLDTSLERS